MQDNSIIKTERRQMVRRGRQCAAIKRVVRSNVGTPEQRREGQRLLNKVQAHFIEPGLFRVPSQWRWEDTGRPTAWHTVTILDDQGNMVCGCDWSKHHPESDCTHIQAVRRRLKREAAKNRWKLYPRPGTSEF